jgi:hypothetical protein
MALSELPVPDAIQRSIGASRYEEAATALEALAASEPSVPRLLALATMQLLLGDLLAAKENALQVVQAAPRNAKARALLARIRAALDERPAALADFRAALDLSFAAVTPPADTPAHLALHNLEQLGYLEQAKSLRPGTLLPVAPPLREEARRRLSQLLQQAGTEVPAIKLGGQVGHVLAHPPLVLLEEAPPARCLNPDVDWAAIGDAYARHGNVACIDNLLTAEALAQLQRFCLGSTVWRHAYRHGYIGAFPETGFFNGLLLQLAAELKQALPNLLGDHHLGYWWSFVSQHGRPGTDIHADQSDVSLNFWITPDAANQQPDSGGLDMWNVEAPSDWSFDDYNTGTSKVHDFLKQSGGAVTTYAYRENRGLLFKGTLFHQTADLRFADGFENRRRNITMLFGRTKRH